MENSAAEDHHSHHSQGGKSDENWQSERPKVSSMEVPPRSTERALEAFTKTDISSISGYRSTRSGPIHKPSSAKIKSPLRNIRSQRSFSTKSSSREDEKAILIISDPSEGPMDKPTTSRSFSLDKIFSLSRIMQSLPLAPNSNLASGSSRGKPMENNSSISQKEVRIHLKRSLSVPANINTRTRSLGRINPGRMIRVISATPLPAAVQSTEDAAEDIPEEEAVCRICLIELAEGGDTLKMGCSCKGDLALAHKECAVKWFSIKGNRTCDVCKQDVVNLPVTLLKVNYRQNVIRPPSTTPEERQLSLYRAWQDVTVLVVISILAYFCFFERLLVSDLGSYAVSISLPVSCILGILSSLIAYFMVRRSCAWAYACFQLAFVIIFGHIFYGMLDVSPILAILLASFTGLGLAMSTTCLLKECLRWRASRELRSLHQNIEQQQ